MKWAAEAISQFISICILFPEFCLVMYRILLWVSHLIFYFSFGYLLSIAHFLGILGIPMAASQPPLATAWEDKAPAHKAGGPIHPLVYPFRNSNWSESNHSASLDTFADSKVEHRDVAVVVQKCFFLVIAVCLFLVLTHGGIASDWLPNLTRISLCQKKKKASSIFFLLSSTSKGFYKRRMQ